MRNFRMTFPRSLLVVLIAVSTVGASVTLESTSQEFAVELCGHWGRFSLRFLFLFIGDLLSMTSS